ncbi:MAG: LptF/LptG family permease [Alphaproteobacteria bacterium]|nr:LptF/LptG family permease [Alphaproteobacteria bacterium]
MSRYRILNRFLMRRFFSGVGLVLLVVCGIILAVTFVERLPSNPNAVAAIMDAWSRLMEYIPLFLPMAIFMGTLFASYNLTKSSENIIIAGAGLSPYQMARPFLVGAALIGIFATTVINPYSVHLSTREITTDHLKLVDNAVWLREAGENGFITLRAESIGRDGENLVFNNATAFVQGSDFKLTERVMADHITLSDNGMDAESAHTWNGVGGDKQTSWHADTQLTPRTVLDRYLQPDQISFWQLPSFIKKMENVGIPVRSHWVQFWTLLFLPLSMIAMATLGIAFSQTRQRRNYSFGFKFSIGIATCFASYFTINMFNALGATGVLPPILAIIAPPLIIIAGAGVFIASFDTI